MICLTPDIRFAFPQVQACSRPFLAAIITLTLGIGANTAIFSLVDGIALSAASNRRSRPPGGDRKREKPRRGGFRETTSLRRMRSSRMFARRCRPLPMWPRSTAGRGAGNAR